MNFDNVLLLTPVTTDVPPDGTMVSETRAPPFTFAYSSATRMRTDSLFSESFLLAFFMAGGHCTDEAKNSRSRFQWLAVPVSQLTGQIRAIGVSHHGSMARMWLNFEV